MSRHLRLIAAFFAAALLLASTSCSSDDDASDTTVAADDEGTDTGDTPDGDRPLPAERDRPDTPSAAVVEELTAGNGPVMTDFTAEAIEAAGYVETEFAVNGTATSYTVDDPETDLPGSGEFDLSEGDTADYQTRVMVRRPPTPDEFNGTVVVEWLNVSGGIDANPDWVYLSDELLRGGYAWVGVSAQHIGVEGGPVAVAVDIQMGEDLAGKGLKAIDPERYGDLSHPGDAYAYDIFTQVSRLVRTGGAEGLLGDLEPEAVLAAGESQSAFALTTYANGVQPLTQEFDGFFIHSRGGAALPLGEPDAGVGIADSIAGTPTVIRADLGVPALILQTESDTLGVLNFFPARQEDTDQVVTWEVAGTAHADQYLIGGLSDGLCPEPINDGPTHFMARSGIRYLDEWSRGGDPPPSGDLYEIDESSGTPTYVRDENSIIEGGIRTPVVDAPTQLLTGEPSGDAIACMLMGSTFELSPETIAGLYDSVEQYEDEFEAATDAAIEAGFLLEDDRDAMLEEARPDLVEAAMG